MDFSGLSLIKLRKEEMESQVSHGTVSGKKSDCFYNFYNNSSVLTWFIFPFHVDKLDMELILNGGSH